MTKFIYTPASWSPEESAERTARAIDLLVSMALSSIDKDQTGTRISEKSDQPGVSTLPVDPKPDYSLAT